MTTVLLNDALYTAVMKQNTILWIRLLLLCLGGNSIEYNISMSIEYFSNHKKYFNEIYNLMRHHIVKFSGQFKVFQYFIPFAHT